LNRLCLVSFIDCIEIGEDNAINFVFNNIETVNLLQAIVDSDKAKSKDTHKARLISMGKLFGEHLERAEPKLAVGGVC
ncbi:recombinase, partial [Streptococcus pyogenes]